MSDETFPYMVKIMTTQRLSAMGSFLQKGADYAAEIKVDEAVLLDHRFAPTMFALARQVQVATGIAKRGAARLAGETATEMENTETSFAELIARCSAVSDYIDSLDDEAISANERIKTDIRLGPKTVHWDGRDYATRFMLPNMHFHVATAYSLLRAQGVKLKKSDFLVP